MDGTASAGSGDNDFSGTAGNVVQTDQLHGGVHVHSYKVPDIRSPRQLPADVAHFTGRELEVRKLDQLVDTNTHEQSAALVISVIAASGGMGKTSLAVHWAHRVQEHFPDGQLYVNLQGYDAASPVVPEQALDGLLRALDVPDKRIPHDVGSQAAMYRSLLAGRRVLVILDNAAAAEQVRPLLPGSRPSVVIVTSRNRLSGLVARDGAQRLSLDLLSRTEAITLLRNVIGERVDTEPEATVELARRCSYLPLALRIAAERVVTRPHYNVTDLVDEIANEQSSLDFLAADDDEDTAVRNVFSWSYRALPEDAARVFRLLGLHPGPETSTSAAAALTNLPLSVTRRRLDLLVSVHLLEQKESDRYRFHDLLRAYAAECSAVDELESERRNGISRVLKWYLHSTHAALRVAYPQHPNLPIDAPDNNCFPLAFNDSSRAMQWYHAEHANLMAAIRQAGDYGYHSIAWKIAQCMDFFLATLALWNDRVIVHHAGLDSARKAPSKLGETWALGHLGEAYVESGRFDTGMHYISELLELSRSTGDRWHEGNATNSFGVANLGLGRTNQAVDQFTKALSIYREIDHRRNQGVALLNLSKAFRAQHRFDDAMEHARSALAVYREMDAQTNIAVILSEIGSIYLDRGEPRKSIEYFDSSVEICRKYNHTHSIAQSLKSRGDAYRSAGDLDAAGASWQESLSILENLNDPTASSVRERLTAIDGFK